MRYDLEDYENQYGTEAIEALVPYPMLQQYEMLVVDGPKDRADFESADTHGKPRMTVWVSDPRSRIPWPIGRVMITVDMTVIEYEPSYLEIRKMRIKRKDNRPNTGRVNIYGRMIDPRFDKPNDKHIGPWRGRGEKDKMETFRYVARNSRESRLTRKERTKTALT